MDWQWQAAAPANPSGLNALRASREALLCHIRAIQTETKGKYSWPRGEELAYLNVRVGKGRVQSRMQSHSIKARGKFKFVVIMDSKYNLPIAENLLAR